MHEMRLCGCRRVHEREMMHLVICAGGLGAPNLPVMLIDLSRRAQT